MLRCGLLREPNWADVFVNGQLGLSMSSRDFIKSSVLTARKHATRGSSPLASGASVAASQPTAEA